MFFEANYENLVENILDFGEIVKTRNGYTKRLFAKTLVIEDLKYGRFPLLTGRKIYWKGVAGEFAAMIRGPKSIKDFEQWGCKYWKLWADKDGKLKLDYGNSWLNWNGVNQLQNVINTIRNNPTDRRMVINGWNPDNVINNKLSLPCCHYSYQFFVTKDGHLDMLWNQRSADVMIGVPSDIVFAAIWLTTLANHTELKPGKITMMFGDTHIYEEHIDGAEEYLKRAKSETPNYMNHCYNIYNFKPDDLEIIDYLPNMPIKFKLKG